MNVYSFTLVAQTGQFVETMLIIIGVFCAAILTSEYKNGTLKLTLIRPYTRFNVLAAKFIGLFIAIVLFNLIITFSSYIVGFLVFGTKGGLVVGGETLSAADAFVKTMLQTAYMIFVQTAIAATIFLLAVVLENGYLVIVIGIGASFVFSIINSIFLLYPMQSKILETIMKIIPFTYLYRSIVGLGGSDLIWATMIPLITLVISFYFAAELFMKKEILM